MKKILIGIVLAALTTGQALAAKGDVWYRVVPRAGNTAFDLNIYADAKNHKIGAYQFRVTYDPKDGIDVDTSAGTLKGVSVGADGFVSAANTTGSGQVIVNGFDAAGHQSNKAMHVVTIHFEGSKKNARSIVVTVDSLANEEGMAIGQ